jgi:hypothetical protein
LPIEARVIPSGLSLSLPKPRLSPTERLEKPLGGRSLGIDVESGPSELPLGPRNAHVRGSFDRFLAPLPRRAADILQWRREGSRFLFMKSHCTFAALQSS